MKIKDQQRRRKVGRELELRQIGLVVLELVLVHMICRLGKEESVQRKEKEESMEEKNMKLEHLKKREMKENENEEEVEWLDSLQRLEARDDKRQREKEKEEESEEREEVEMKMMELRRRKLEE
jgi:hypothetical protein